jgi:hypothetical protein
MGYIENLVAGAAPENYQLCERRRNRGTRMQFKEHPDFDRLDANEWIELDNGTEPLEACAAPYADMIQVYCDNQQYIEERAITTIKRHLGEAQLVASIHEGQKLSVR